MIDASIFLMVTAGLIDTKQAFTRCRTDSTCEFREIIGFVKSVQRVAPLPSVDQIIPLRDQIRDGATVIALAERYAAINRARPVFQDAMVPGPCKFLVIK